MHHALRSEAEGLQQYVPVLVQSAASELGKLLAEQQALLKEARESVNREGSERRRLHNLVQARFRVVPFFVMNAQGVSLYGVVGDHAQHAQKWPHCPHRNLLRYDAYGNKNSIAMARCRGLYVWQLRKLS